MPSTQQWVYTDVVSGEIVTLPRSGLPDRWAIIDGDCHGPMGLYIIAQRLITRVILGLATYADASNTPYDPTSDLDNGYVLTVMLTSSMSASSDLLAAAE